MKYVITPTNKDLQHKSHKYIERNKRLKEATDSYWNTPIGRIELSAIDLKDNIKRLLGLI